MANTTLISILLALGVVALGVSGVEAGKAGKKPPKQPTATPEPTATTPPCVGCPDIHVGAMVVGSTKLAKGGNTRGGCRVFIMDDDGNYIAGATVEHIWSGAVSATQFDVTDYHEENEVPFTWVQIDGPKCGRGGAPVYTCTVGSVSAPGYTDAPTKNVVNSGLSTVWQCG